MTHLIAPERANLYGKRVIFLAGSIEMGKAEDWQARIATELLRADPRLVVANPRRASWDASWEQSIHNPLFRGQVEWELDHIERANLVLFYFQPSTQSPVTLLELGKHLERDDAATSTLVCCPDGFWRKGNVEIACKRRGVQTVLNTFDDLVTQARQWAATQ